MFKKYLVGKTDNSFVQFIRYGFVAGVAFVIDFGLLYVFTQYLHFFYLVSATLSFLISLYFNYLLSTIWVFPYSGRSKAVQISGFLAIGLIGLVLNLLIIWALTSWFGLFYLASKVVAIIIVFFWSFIGRRYLFSYGKKIES